MALRSRLEKQPTDLRRQHHYMRDGALPSRAVLSRSIKNGRIVRVDEVARLGSTCAVRHWILSRPRAAKSCLMVDSGGGGKNAFAQCVPTTAERHLVGA